MADAWKPRLWVGPDLFFKPQVEVIAAIIGQDRYSTVGRLLRLWMYAQDKALDNGYIDTTPALIDAMVALPGFCAAVEKAGWLRAGETNGVIIVNIQEHIAKGAIRLTEKQTRMIERKPKAREVAQSQLFDGPTAIEFPCVGGSRPEETRFKVSEDQVRIWETTFPGVDVMAELRKALAWINANHKKTYRGYPRFCYGWLQRANDRGQRPNVPPNKPAAAGGQDDLPARIKAAREAAEKKGEVPW